MPTLRKRIDISQQVSRLADRLASQAPQDSVARPLGSQVVEALLALVEDRQKRVGRTCDIDFNDTAITSNRLHIIDSGSSTRANPSCVRDKDDAQSLEKKLVAKKAATETELHGLLFTRAFGVSSSGDMKRHLAQLLPSKDAHMDDSFAIPLGLLCSY
jgi:hypothetical protein